MDDQANELSITDWLQRIPARSLAHYVPGPDLKRQLIALPEYTRVTDVEHAVKEADSLPVGLPKDNRDSIARAARVYRRNIRTRKLRAIRPESPSWAIPDEVGFRLEGRSSQILRRRQRFLTELIALSESEALDSSEGRAVNRVVEILDRIQSFPNFLYWYSPFIVNRVRRASHGTLQEVNLCATHAVRSLGINCSISTWEDKLGIITRRIPLGIVTAHVETRRSRNFINQLENLGVHTLGGLAVASRDSSFFLSHVQVRTLQNLASALKGVHRLRES